MAYVFHRFVIRCGSVYRAKQKVRGRAADQKVVRRYGGLCRINGLKTGPVKKKYPSFDGYKVATLFNALVIFLVERRQLFICHVSAELRGPYPSRQQLSGQKSGVQMV